MVACANAYHPSLVHRAVTQPFSSKSATGRSSLARGALA